MKIARTLVGQAFNKLFCRARELLIEPAINLIQTKLTFQQIAFYTGNQLHIEYYHYNQLQLKWPVFCASFFAIATSVFSNDVWRCMPVICAKALNHV